MTIEREKGLVRQRSFEVDNRHPYYLHLRSLFADLQRAATLAKGRLLDVGCGNKPYELMFVGRVAEYIGCDVVQSSDQRVDVVCPATSLDFESGTFDTVLCTQVIEHVADHRALLAEAFRVLRPDGVLILSGPMYWPLHEEPYDFFRFTQHGLSWLLGELGFVEVAIVANGGDWAVCGQVLLHTIYGAVRGLGRSAGTRSPQGSVAQKGWLARARFSVLALALRLVTQFVNAVFGYIDRRRPRFTNPMNYVVTAYKRSPA